MNDLNEDVGQRSPIEEPRAIASPLEDALAMLWATVLQTSRVEPGDDFFLLGGDSQCGARLLRSVNEVFGVELSATAIAGDLTTVTGMARAIEAARAEARPDPHPHVAQNAMAPAPIPRRQIRGPAPLSDTQRRFWFLAALDPGSSAYQAGRAYRLNGKIDPLALASAVGWVITRHEILRSTYAVVDGKLCQTVRDDATLDFQCFDLSATPAAQLEEVLRRLLLAETKMPFNLAAGPLVRMRWIRLSAQESVLLRVLPHIVCDGWSGGIFAREVSAAYNAFVKGSAPALPELPVQYADYAKWQCDRLQDEVLDAQLEYWETKLADLPTLELPTDRVCPVVPSDRGASYTLELPRALMRTLKALSQREGATLFMTLLAAFQVLLYRYSAQEDIAVGTPIAGRRRVELEDLIGFFTNTLVLRTDLSSNPAFRDLLARVRETTLGAFMHQEVPFERLVEELAPRRNLGRNPLFRVMFALQNAPSATLALDGIRVSGLPMPSHSTMFDLYVSLAESDGGLHAQWEYATDLFDASTIERMAGHFEHLLEAIVADPGQRIGELPMLGAAERHQLLVEWNDTAADYPKDRCIQQLVEEQTARTPDATAVSFGAQNLTYRELDVRANSLAAHLHSRGVGSGTIVAICMQRSIELVVALLGTLKSGAAYLPLDPGLPAERLRFMLEDTAAPIVLTHSFLASSLTPFSGNVFCIDRDCNDISRAPEDPARSMDARSPAYVIYTSGSTGKPKGTVIHHQALVNHVLWMCRTFGFDRTDRVLQKTSISFDASIWEFYAPLLVGATLVLAPEDIHASPDMLAVTLRDQRITLLQLVPTMLEAMLDVGAFRDCRSLRWLFCGGEVLESKLARVFCEQSSARLVNLYGPSETTIDCSSFAYSPGEDLHPVPIGRPIANTSLHVLDRYGVPVPIGAAGELHVSGDAVGLGYLNRPELTAERFVRDPFSGIPGAKMYRSGDLVRYRPDGNLEYLGRIDDQVKIRGFRVEPGEIEAQLREHPAVRQAVVIAREDTPGEKRLVAYVVPADASSSDFEPIRAFLRERLPEYMRPAAYVLLERVPLTPNGKVDRRALPAPQYGREQLGDTFVAPRNAIEEVMAKVWREVLKIERVGVHDDFFDLGGHSLLATMVITRLAKLLKIAVPLRWLFEAPTIAALAERAAQQTKRTRANSARG